MNYNAINFKNKDIDKFSTRFGNNDPKKKSETSDRTNMSTPNLPTFETAKPKSNEKDWRERSVIGAVLHGTPVVRKDKGGKKGDVVKCGKGGRPDYGNMDESCKNPNSK
jgi:hypothetical protein